MRFTDEVFGEFWVTDEVFGDCIDVPGLRPVPMPFRAILASWPIPARQAWGERANELAGEGFDFPNDELVAFAEIKARLDAGEFSGSAPLADIPGRCHPEHDMSLFRRLIP